MQASERLSSLERLSLPYISKGLTSCLFYYKKPWKALPILSKKAIPRVKGSVESISISPRVKGLVSLLPTSTIQ